MACADAARAKAKAKAKAINLIIFFSTRTLQLFDLDLASDQQADQTPEALLGVPGGGNTGTRSHIFG